MKSNKRPLLALLVCPLVLALAACKDEAPPQQPSETAAASPSPMTQAEALKGVETQLQEEARQNPDDPNSFYNLGNVYTAQGRHREAADEYEKAVAKSPKDFEALTRLGDARLALGQTDEAVKAYQRALEAKPDYGEARLRLSEAYAKAGRAADAERERAEALRVAPNEAGKRLLGENKLAEAIAELQKVPNKNAETYLLIGSAHLHLDAQPGASKDEHKTAALAAYREAVRLDPKHANAQFNLANAYSRLGRHEEAAEAFKQATRLRPDDSDAHFNLGNEYAQLKRDKEAVAAYQQAVKLNPSDADARLALGLLHAKNGDRAAALEQHEALKQLKPDAAAALLKQLDQPPPTGKP